ncbi:hypothetical protein GGS20DRAFT_552405 [Poronia punctata]|nr:hypothetical protein GGS20DRAFT_552405 [Poronia punctata]
MSDESTWRQHLYHQTRLKEKNGRIRLLTIQPRQYAESRPEAPPNTIHCLLRLAKLDEHPPFTVISHRWQATDAIDETKSVFVNGIAVPVSTGLWDVIGQIQKQTEPVVVWIDALCINHADEHDTEKSVQISQLAQIYAVAQKSLIWLGPASERSDEAMKALRRLSEEQLTIGAYVANWTPQLAHQLAQKILPARFINNSNPNGDGNGNENGNGPGTIEPVDLQRELESLRAPLKSLMERDYWTHLWSLVELSLSHKGVLVCGSHGLVLEHFHSAARALDHIINHFAYSKWLASNNAEASNNNNSSAGVEISNLSQSPALRILSRREEYRKDVSSWLKTPETPLFTLLNRFWAVPQSSSSSSLSLRVSDPRDKVYALSCLATDADVVAVDYSKDLTSINVESSAAFVQKYPRVLQLARGAEAEAENNDNNTKIPSWAIDWQNVRLPPSDLTERPFNACGPADIRYYRADQSKPGCISLKAAILDTVEEIGEPYTPSPDDKHDDKDKENIRSYLTQIRQLWEESTASISSPYFAEQAAVALAKIPVGEVEGNHTLTRASTATVEGYKRTYEALFPEEEETMEEAAAAAEEKSISIPYVEAVARMSGRRPFRTRNGYVGIGPSGLMVSDVVVIPYGSAVPFAFRSEEGDCHRSVGEVYVFGIMDGEFMKVHRKESLLHVV